MRYVEALRKVARHHTEAGAVQLAATALEEAIKALRDAPDSAVKPKRRTTCSNCGRAKRLPITTYQALGPGARVQ